MKRKLIIHYFISFILACSVIFITNVSFMIFNIYNNDSLYNYNPSEIIANFKNYISLDDNKIIVNQDGVNLLRKNNLGLQILNQNNNEVFSYNKPSSAPYHYSNKDIINRYNNKDNTLFLEEKVLDNITYTYLLFFDSEVVNRVNYTYDVSLVKKAHHFPILVGLNIALILLVSFLFTIKITRPIHKIVDKIESLYKGNYWHSKVNAGIYVEVEEKLNQLCNRLSLNEKERKKLETMREEWISNITHDIKTPLTSIIGNAEIMADTNYHLEDEIRAKYCNTIISKSEYIKTLVEDLNLSTRLKNNSIILRKKKINIVSLVRHILIDIINDESYNLSNISFNYSQEEIYLNIDEQLIKRVIINLITNAFLHNDNNVVVTINIESLNNDSVKISICDNGQGISDEELKYIFKRYYRGTNTRRKIEGSGLGMAIAHDIIKAHNGELYASSKLGEGLNINIIL